MRLLFWIKVFLFAALYIISGWWGLSVHAVGGLAAPFWPPTGLSLAFLILFGQQYWPAITIGAFLLNYAHAASFFCALLISVGNTLEAIAGSYIVKRINHFRIGLDRLRDVAFFVALVAVGSTAISALIGATSLWIGNFIHIRNWAEAFSVWWAGDMTSALVLTPILLVLESSFKKSFVNLNFKKIFEGVIFVSLTILVCSVAFEFFPQWKFRLVCPFLLWACIRFEQKGAVLFSFIVSAIGIWQAAISHIGPADKFYSLTDLQLYMGIFSAMGLVLAAAMSERRQANETVKQVNEALERKIEDRTQALHRKNEELRIAEIDLRALNLDLERRVEERTLELKKANEELQQFVYITSHDLQEPLRTITGFGDLLAAEHSHSLSGEGKKYLDFVVRGAHRMAHLIQDLLSYNRAGQGGVVMKPVDLNAVIDKVRESLLASLESSNGKIISHFLPTVVADESLITQVFQNLAANAIKFRSENPPLIEIEAREEEGFWEFRVKDNGIGIHPHYQKRIFEMFQRLHSRDSYPGNGIGLSLCKKIVEQHGGRIWVESNPGVGSSFIFTIRKSVNLGLWNNPQNQKKEGTYFKKNDASRLI